MKSQGLVSILSTLLLLFTSCALAWPGVLENVRPGAVVARQNSNSGSASQTASPSASGSSSGSASQSASRTETNSNSNSNSGSASQTGSSSTQSGSGSSSLSVTSASRNSTKTAIDPRLPPGGVAMITPGAFDGMTFVKVGNQVTFKWNYTSLSVTPKYIDVVATNTVNHQTYTIAGNQSWEKTQAVTWDTNAYTQTADLPFVVATYTLMIYDSSSDPTAMPKAGYLGSFSNLQFGIYTPQAYTPLNEFRCATCSGAMSIHEKQALGILLGTCTITMLSFTWFASGFFGLF